MEYIKSDSEIAEEDEEMPLKKSLNLNIKDIRIEGLSSEVPSGYGSIDKPEEEEALVDAKYFLVNQELLFRNMLIVPEELERGRTGIRDLQHLCKHGLGGIAFVLVLLFTLCATVSYG